MNNHIYRRFESTNENPPSLSVHREANERAKSDENTLSDGSDFVASLDPAEIEYQQQKERIRALPPGTLSREPLLPDPFMDYLRVNRLDFLSNKVETSYCSHSGLLATGRVHVKPHTCRCRTCPECGPRYGRKVQSRMIERASLFKNPRMFTLTVKPSNFDNDSEKAYRFIQQEGYISELMRVLRVKNWFWILELQQSGFPHWHFLIDAPGGFVDYNKAWEKWGWMKEGWKIGGVDVGKSDFNGSDHAVLYITKYLVKFPAHAFRDPQYAWILDTDRRVRWVAGSRSVGPLVSKLSHAVKDRAREADPDENPEEKTESLPETHIPLRWRQGLCGTAYEFMREFINQNTGELTYRYAGRCNRKIVDVAFDEDNVQVEEDQGRSFIILHGDVDEQIHHWARMFFSRNNRSEMPWADNPNVIWCRRRHDLNEHDRIFS